MGLSNSCSQRDYILGAARERGLKNVEVGIPFISKFAAEEWSGIQVITADLNYHEFPSSVKFVLYLG